MGRPPRGSFSITACPLPRALPRPGPRRGTVRLFPRYPNELSLIAKRPGMIGTLEGFGVARLLQTHKSPPVCTGIEQGAHLPVTAPRQNDRSASHAAGAKVARLGNLRGVTSV